MTENSIEQRKGEKFVLWGAVLWSGFPVIIVLSYARLTGLISLAWSGVFAVLFFSLLVTYNKSWSELKNKNFWKDIIGVAFFNGILFYGFYYLGLEYTTAGNASLIALMEIFTTFLFFNLFKGEPISKEHKLGALLMFSGAVIVLSHNFSHFNKGDLLVFAATFCGPIGNHFQQRVRKIASSTSILFSRYLVATPFIFILAYFFNKNISLGFTKESLILLLVNGFLILGLGKVFWIEGIHRMPVTKAIAMSSFGPLFTLLLAWLLLKQPPTILQLVSFVPLFLGILLLTDNLKLKR